MLNKVQCEEYEENVAVDEGDNAEDITLDVDESSKGSSIIYCEQENLQDMCYLAYESCLKILAEARIPTKCIKKRCKSSKICMQTKKIGTAIQLKWVIATIIALIISYILHDIML